MTSGLRKDDKIFVAGHRGLVGSAIVDVLGKKGYAHVIQKTRAELDLRDQAAVRAFYRETKPDVVFIAAAKVGGIHANNTYRADFIAENLMIQNNLIWGAHESDVRRLVFLGSSCIYPRNCPQPMKEEYLLTGELEETNRPYAIAKIAGLELVHSIRRQYGRDWFSVMPTNLYGPNDNFHPENSHVLPAMIRRFCAAKSAGAKDVTIWGTGKPKREFMYSKDCAAAIVYLAENLESKTFDDAVFQDECWSHINIGSSQEVSIAELARLIAQIVGFEGEIRFDPTKPDGTLRKLLDTGVLRGLGWEPNTELEDGIRKTVAWFLGNH